MASLSTNLEIMELVYGESGAYGYTNWGDLTNANLAILESALTDQSSISVTTADVTLTEEQHVSLYLNLSGALTGDRSILLRPDQKGFWFIKNGTTGDYTVTVKPDGGSGITVTRGFTSVVYSNGTTAAIVGSADNDPPDPFEIGDFFGSARTLSSDWLRRDGSLYDSADYPDLAALLPALDDGVEWDLEAANTTAQGYSIVEAEGRLTAAYANGTTANIAASIDGGAWNVRASITGFTNPHLAYGNGIFVAVDGNGNYSTSPDGDTWGAATSLDPDAGFVGLAFGASLFVGAGLKADGTHGGIWSSPDGTTWTERTSGVTNILNGIEFVNSIFIVTGRNGVILTSPDGITWTSRTSGSILPLNSAGYTAGTYVVCGAGGTILTSTNLTGWTSRTSGVSTELRSVVGSANGFLAVGDSGVAIISDDGITWTPTITGLSITLRNAIVDSVDAAKFYVVGDLTSILYGVRTFPTQFRVPDDDPTYGWIRALIS